MKSALDLPHLPLHQTIIGVIANILMFPCEGYSFSLLKLFLKDIVNISNLTVPPLLNLGIYKSIFDDFHEVCLTSICNSSRSTDQNEGKIWVIRFQTFPSSIYLSCAR